eukprot:gb/GECG01005402.1/.p1 GENE.gb/GECG01005402.1/~~gb/GECG01005402.1/.p1  ORF type:complete len:186 (+),score=11.51 gb/GECG01005402.1/:1-558(+)
MDVALGIRPYLENIAPCVPYDAVIEQNGYFPNVNQEGYHFPIVRMTHRIRPEGQVELRTHTFLFVTQMGATIKSDMEVHDDGETSSEDVVLKSIDERCLVPVNAPGERPRYRVFNRHGRLIPGPENPVIELKIMRELKGRHHIMSLKDYCRGSGMHYAAMPYADCKPTKHWPWTCGDSLNFLCLQ